MCYLECILALDFVGNYLFQLGRMGRPNLVFFAFYNLVLKFKSYFEES